MQAVLLLAVLSGGASASSHYRIDKDYEKTIPSNDGAPLPITCSWHLRSIMNVNEAAGIIDLDLTWRFFWRDRRIQGSNLTSYVTISQDDDPILKKIWIPDIMVDQAKKSTAARIFIDPSSVRIWHNGTIRYAARRRVQFNCVMDFREFPVDVQVCSLVLHSFAFTTADYTLKFRKEQMLVGEDTQAAQFAFKVDYDDDFDMKSGDEQLAGLKFVFHFRRRFTSHFMQEYLPSLLMVVSAYGSLYLPPVSLNARGGMSLITLLNTFKINEGIRQTIPRVAYITWLDIWLMMCFLVIFYINFEFIGVLCFIAMGKDRSAKLLEDWSKYLVPAAVGLFSLGYGAAILYRSLDKYDSGPEVPWI